MFARAIDLSLTGMTCAACAARIEKVLNRAEGVHAAVNFATETAHVEFDAERAPAVADRSRAQGRVRSSAAVDPFLEPEQARSRGTPRYRKDLATFAIAALLTSPLVAQMFFMFEGRHDLLLPVWLQALLATPVQFWAGARFYRGAWNALRGGAANMDVLVALGTTAAYVYSVAVWLIPLAGQHVYFEAATVVITLVLLGKLLEGRAKARTATAIRQLLMLRPPTVLRERDGDVTEVPLAELRVGDVFIVRAGASVPVDGRVLTGESTVNEAMLTGESQPVVKVPRDGVLAGTVNESGPLRCEATAVGQSTLLAGIVSQVAAAQGSKAPVQRLADAVSAWFVPAVLVVGGDHARGQRPRIRRLGRGADARNGRSCHRVPMRARSRDTHRADGRRRPGRAPRHSRAQCRLPRARREDRRAGRRQDRDVDGRHAVRRCNDDAARIHGERFAAFCEVARGRRYTSARTRHCCEGRIPRARADADDRGSRTRRPWRQRAARVRT